MKKRISIKIFFLSAVIITMAVLYFGYLSIVNIEKDLNNKSTYLLDLLSSVSQDYILYREYTTLDKISEEIVQDEDIAFIRYKDTNGNVISNYPKQIDKTNLTLKQIAILNDGKIIGVVEVGIKNQKKQDMLIQTFITLGILLIVFVIAIQIAMNRIVVRPIYKIVRTAKEVSHGNYSKRIRISGRNEFAYLAKVFNQMLDRMELKKSQLENEILDRKQAEFELKKSENSLALAQQIAHLGNWELNLKTNEIAWSDEVFRILNYTKEKADLTIEHFLKFVHPDDLEILKFAFDQTLHNGEKFNIDFRIIKNENEITHVHSEGEVLFDESITPIKFIGIIKDITDIKESEAKLNYIAYHDSLTALPNRLLFLDRLEQALIKAKRTECIVALLFLDLDRFKIINDTLGHSVGDALLKKVAQRLSQNLRESDSVARLGGDEFTILLPEVEKLKDVSVIAQKVLESLEHCFKIEDQEFFLTTSIGISCFPYNGKSCETLLKNADIAMYQAKSFGGNNFQFFSESLSDIAVIQFKLEAKLRKAIEKNEFVIYYQPQYDLFTGELSGMEALTYWHYSGQIISPGEFIPLAEETGLIVPFGEWVLKHACEQNKKWQDQGFKKVPIAVNLSARQFQQKDLVKLIDNVISETKIEPNYLELELTESMLMMTDRILPLLKKIKDRGIKISIDDFGTGYSSLSYLKKFPIDTLKIDQSFIKDLATDKDDASITKAIISMGHSLRLEVIAEGVEEISQVELLKEFNCERAQGYFFGKPMLAEKFSDYLM